MDKILSAVASVFAFLNNVLGPLLENLRGKAKAKEDTLKDIGSEEEKRSGLSEQALLEKQAEDALEKRHQERLAKENPPA